MFNVFMYEVSVKYIRSKLSALKLKSKNICTTVADGGTNFVRFATNFAFCDCNLTSSDAKRKKRRKTKRKTRCKTNDRI